jgi:hypothetical protein
MAKHVFGINPLVRNYRFRKLTFLLLATGLFGVGGYKYNSQKESVLTPSDHIKVMTFNEIQTKDQFQDVEQEISKGQTLSFYDSTKSSNKLDT